MTEVAQRGPDLGRQIEQERREDNRRWAMSTLLEKEPLMERGSKPQIPAEGKPVWRRSALTTELQKVLGVGGGGALEGWDLVPRYFGERTFFHTNSGRCCCCLDVQITAEECGWAVLVIELLSLGFVMLGTGHHKAHLCFAASF